MSSIERRRRSRRSSRSSASISPLRLVLLGCVGLTLMGAAYQTALAGPGNGPRAVYRSDEGGGLTPGEGAAIGGGAALIGGLLYLRPHPLPPPAFLIGEPHECKERFHELPEGEEVDKLRLVPEDSEIDAGWCRCFHLEARSRKTGKWYSVTHRPEARIYEIDDPRTPLVQMDGHKNIFCLPITAPQSFNGQTTLLEGTFSPPGQQPLRAEARVQMRVGEEAGLFRNDPRGYDEGTLRRGPSEH